MFSLRGFILKPTKKAYVILENSTRNFQNSPSFERSVGILNVFDTLTLKQIFWKTETLFRKLEYRFLVESNNIEKT